MALSVETVGRLLASGRNYVSTIVGFIGGVGIMSASQSKGLGDAFTEIFNGLSMVVHGATSAWAILIVAFPIIGAIMAKFASNSASTPNQAASVNAAIKDPNTPITMEIKAAVLDTAARIPEVTKPIIVSDPVLAAATPATNVRTTT